MEQTRTETSAENRSYGSVFAQLLAVAAAVGLALVTGRNLAAAGPRTLTILPLAAAGAVALAVLAFVRFETFVLVVLGLRSTLDYAKLGTAEAGGMDPAAALALVFVVASALWLAGSGANARPLSPLAKALLAFLAAALLSVPGAVRPASSLLELSRIAAMVMMLVVLERMLADVAAMRRVLLVAFLSAVVPVVVAGTQAGLGSGLVERGGFVRARGTFVHPNPFAMYLVFLVLMGAGLYPRLPRKAKPPLLALLGACCLCLLLTYTRAGWIALVVGLAVVGVLQSRALLAAVVVAVAAAVIAVPSVTARFSDLDQERHLSGTAGNSLVWRFEYWSESLSLGEGSFGTGIGLDMVEFETEEGKAPHNDFVRVFVETGLVGLAAYVWLVLALVHLAWRSLKSARPGLDQGVAVGFAACVVAFLIFSIVANVISQVVILWYFAAFAAAAEWAARRGEALATGAA